MKQKKEMRALDYYELILKIKNATFNCTDGCFLLQLLMSHSTPTQRVSNPTKCFRSSLRRKLIFCAVRISTLLSFTRDMWLPQRLPFF